MDMPGAKLVGQIAARIRKVNDRWKRHSVHNGSHFPRYLRVRVTRPQRPMKMSPAWNSRGQVNHGTDVGASLRSVKYPFPELPFKPRIPYESAVRSNASAA
jgi:hypothetical protein